MGLRPAHAGHVLETRQAITLWTQSHHCQREHPHPPKNILPSDQQRESGQRALGAITPSFVHYTHEIVLHSFCEGPFKNILRRFFSLSPSRASALGSLTSRA